MKMQILNRGIAAVVAAGALAVIGACSLTQFILPPDAGSGCASSVTTAEVNGWFESGTATLNGAVKPANSVLFPNVPNCSFYKWSEQMFLWLTSPAPPRYGSGGLVMNSPAFFDVSLPDGTGHVTSCLMAQGSSGPSMCVPRSAACSICRSCFKRARSGCSK